MFMFQLRKKRIDDMKGIVSRNFIKIHTVETANKFGKTEK